MEFNEIVDKIMSGEKSLSYSALSSFLDSPRHFKKYKTDQETTKAMIEGIRFHMACLEPDKFKEEYWVLDDSEIIDELLDGGAKNPRVSKKYKEWLAEEMIGKEEGRKLDLEEFEMYMSMSEAIRTNSATKDLINNLETTEKRFKYEHDGYVVSGSIDGYHPSYLIDLKKVADASYEKIKWDIRRKNYHMQAGLYCAAVNVPVYYLIYVDKDCNITVVNLLEQTIEEGFNRFEFALAKFNECAETDAWDSSYEFYNGGFIRV